jgi:protein tyrosine phosphatase (PTP) superfamily phosphohydrolase (DUF442 family)
MSSVWIWLAAAIVLSNSNQAAQETNAPPDSSASPAPSDSASRRLNNRRRTPVSPVLEALDANGDGVIDAEEIANASSALLNLDKNDDGQLTPNEYLASTRSFPFGRRPGGPPGLRNGTPSTPQGGLDNFAVVDGHLLRGAQPSATGIQTLKALGVTTIIDLKVPDRIGESEKAEAERSGILYTNIPLASLTPPTLEQVQAILGAITNAPGKVFLHCRAGKDRTGTVVACYRMLLEKWSNEKALHEADDMRLAAGAVRMREFINEFGKPPPANHEVSAGGGTNQNDVARRLIERREKELQ